MTQTPSPLANLTPEEQRALLQQLLQKKGATALSAPLSFAQQRLWFLDQLEPGNAFYNISEAVRLVGPLDSSALARSLEMVVQRHETLRTTFETTQGLPRQRIAPALALPLRHESLAALPAATRDEALRVLASEEAQRPFDLAAGPLIRATLIHLADNDNILIVVMHHIISDGWSLALFIQEMATLYHALVAGQPPVLPPLPLQYREFAQWQREWLQGETLTTQLDYWRQQLAHLPTLEFPTDRVRPPVQHYRGQSLRSRLPRELAEQLHALGQRENATLFMTLLTAWKVLLARYSRQTEIVVGSPIANRRRAELEGLIGFFVNTLVLRTDLEGNPTFLEALARVRESTLGAYAHQDLPFERLVEVLQPVRDPSRTPLFQVMFVLQNTPTPRLELADLVLTPLALETGSAKFDLTLFAIEDGAGLELLVEFNSDLFTEGTITRLLTHFETLLRAVVATPQQRIAALPLLPEAERAQLLGWNPGRAHYANPLPLHERFAAQAARTPNAPAVTFEGNSLSYRELDERANQLAHLLQEHGVGPKTLVPLYLERSLALVVAILGTLKAGGAYLPMDPLYPTERLAFMLEEAQSPVILTEGALAANLPPTESLLLYPEREEWGQQPTTPPILAEAPTLAYVIYTSGSTGKPKGVLVTHENVGRLMDATAPWYAFNEQDVWSLFHSYAFDFSVWELWGALLYGGRLVVVPYWVSRTPDAFHTLLAQEGVTVLNQTPSAFRQLIRADQEAAHPLARLRYVIFGGEALELASLRPWFARYGDARPRLVNMYGITETTVHVTYRPLRLADVEAGEGSVIGEAIPDLQLLILDEQLAPVPIGVPGEMYVGGAGVARGYLNRPELTRTRFLPNPFSPDPEARLYKTGDLARYLADGEIEYLGRSDEQVKIRGFRIEIGEIEAALAQHPLVEAVVVLARPDSSGQKQLVAYIARPPSTPLTSPVLRAFLTPKLPDYMVPAAFVLLDALPLTANGKVDRKALPAPDEGRADLGTLFHPPRTPLEEVLAGIWEEALKVERVGVLDNYFDLGGDSIRSIQLVAHARTRGVTFTIQQLLQYPTVRTLAEAVAASGATEASAPRAPLAPFALLNEAERAHVPADVEDVYPVTLLQAGMLFHSRYTPSAYHDVFSFHLEGKLDEGALRESLAALVAAHPILRTSFDFTSFTEPMQLLHPGATIPLEMLDLSALDEEAQESELAAWLEAEKQRPFDWSQPPLLRLILHRRSGTRFQFALSFHHAILDGWSVASLLSALFQGYAARVAGETPPALAPTSFQFRDYVALEQEALSNEESQTFWSRHLEAAPRAHLSEPEAADPSQVSILPVPISPDLLRGLKRLAREAAVPLKSVLLAAHLRVVALLSGQGEAITGLVTNGRPESEDGERILGLFLNTVPFRLALQGGSWLELVRTTFEAERALLPHRRYPMAALQRQQGGQPLFETAFNFTHFHVYESIQGVEGVRLVGGRVFERTDIPLTANFSVDIASSQLELELSFDTGDVSDGRRQRIRNYYARTLAAMSATPAARYDAQSLLDEEETTLLRRWSQHSAPLPDLPSLQALFEAQAARTPHALAAVQEAHTLTYRALDEQATRLAHTLRALGVGPERVVGLAFERSLEMLVALLGVLKAGGTYLPLDPTYPAARLAFMMQDAAPHVVLTQEGLTLPATRATVLPLHAEMLREGPTHPLPPLPSPEVLAYIIYTSGSTGQPKGVGISHRALINHATATAHTFALQPSDRVLQLASLSFDVAAEEIFPTWASGATVVLGPRQVAALPDFEALIARAGLTVVNLPAPYWHEWVADLARRQATVPDPLRLVVVGSDRVLSHHLADWQRLVGAQVRWLNAYGPTEATISATFYEPGEKRSAQAVVPIGQPLANLEVHLLDPTLHPVPIGVAGELFLGGAGLARGYQQQPALTAERFLPHPFSQQPGARLYHTGDMARYQPDGTLEFLGRADHQVKVRGFRIELGEIEATLRAQPHVASAVVVAHEHTDVPTLLAYVVAHPDASLDPAALRAAVQSQLPAYMVPAAILPLATLPLTPSGKVDTRALPLPADLAVSDRAPYVAPRTLAEEVLASIWAEVFKLERVGVQDNFFTLGGHSLLVIQIASRLREALEIEVPLPLLFETPVLADLAQALETLLLADLEAMSDEDATRLAQ